MKIVSAATLAFALAGCVVAPPPPGGFPGGPPPGPGFPGGPGPGPGPGFPGGPGPGGPGPGGGRECREGPARFALGERYDTDLADEAAFRSGAEVVRIVRPGQAVTMDFNPRRLTIELNSRDRVVGVSCG